VAAISRPERYLLLAETGDERAGLPGGRGLLRRALRQVVLEGGDHGFTRFIDYIPAILAF
jgi:predicted esterase YcpF (UPF0227 family)